MTNDALTRGSSRQSRVRLCVVLMLVGAAVSSCTSDMRNAFARGLASPTRSATSYTEDSERCPTDHNVMYFTGETRSEFGKFLKLYRCPLGHEYWINASGNNANPSALHPCPICGQETYFAGETRLEMGVLQKVYRCPLGHLSVSTK